jgi:hypothetical protein
MAKNGIQKKKRTENIPVSTRPLHDNEKLLMTKFYESIVAQSEQMDKLAEKLLTLQLAIPGLYATALKLVGGDNAVVTTNNAFYLTFLFWGLALAVTVNALTPQKWEVDTTIIKQDPEKLSTVLGIEDFFNETALYKRRRLILSSFLFFAGIVCATFTIG